MLLLAWSTVWQPVMRLPSQATEDADRGKLDVLELIPWLRPLLLDPKLWPEGVNKATRMLYPLIIAALFLGPQVSQCCNMLYAVLCLYPHSIGLSMVIGSVLTQAHVCCMCHLLWLLPPC
jgi:hypothetical protein